MQVSGYCTLKAAIITKIGRCTDTGIATPAEQSVRPVMSQLWMLWMSDLSCLIWFSRTTTAKTIQFKYAVCTMGSPLFDFQQPSLYLLLRCYHPMKKIVVCNRNFRHCILGKAYLTYNGQRSRVNFFHAWYDTQCIPAWYYVPWWANHVKRSSTLKGHPK